MRGGGGLEEGKRRRGEGGGVADLPGRLWLAVGEPQAGETGDNKLESGESCQLGSVLKYIGLSKV